MKHVVVLALVVCLAGCGGSINPAAPRTSGSQQGQQSQTPPTTPATYDMLSWMTMDPTLAVSHHMSGTANPIYTSVLSDRFFWTKTGKGYPWDIQLYDNNYIYLWVTELNWLDPSTYKVFHDPVFGNFNLPLVPRIAQGEFPGSKITIPPSNSTYEIHSDCNTFTTKTLGEWSIRLGDRTPRLWEATCLPTCRRW